MTAAPPGIGTVNLEKVEVQEDCTSETAAHEYGHLLEFFDRYSAPLSSDIMRSSGGGVPRDVQGYHIRRLIEKY